MILLTLDIKFTGGVAIDGGNGDMPKGKANFMDKVVGKMEKVRS